MSTSDDTTYIEYYEVFKIINLLFEHSEHLTTTVYIRYTIRIS